MDDLQEVEKRLHEAALPAAPEEVKDRVIAQLVANQIVAARNWGIVALLSLPVLLLYAIPLFVVAVSGRPPAGFDWVRLLLLAPWLVGALVGWWYYQRSRRALIRRFVLAKALALGLLVTDVVGFLVAGYIFWSPA